MINEIIAWKTVDCVLREDKNKNKYNIDPENKYEVLSNRTS